MPVGMDVVWANHNGAVPTCNRADAASILPSMGRVLGRSAAMPVGVGGWAGGGVGMVFARVPGLTCRPALPGACLCSATMGRGAFMAWLGGSLPSPPACHPPPQPPATRREEDGPPAHADHLTCGVILCQ